MHARIRRYTHTVQRSCVRREPRLLRNAWAILHEQRFVEQASRDAIERVLSSALDDEVQKELGCMAGLPSPARLTADNTFVFITHWSRFTYTIDQRGTPSGCVVRRNHGIDCFCP